ncbi:hypothetical protein EXN66_Car014270 [Channa argus]|uniref:Uncharacterized protein n=1 Tax=Channa argus TaxID=215402 RepID=A0A6G1Q8C5_CHAAH|nr:hypothetical protein EXN66_Car014270 [Channa argus]
MCFKQLIVSYLNHLSSANWVSLLPHARKRNPESSQVQLSGLRAFNTSQKDTNVFLQKKQEKCIKQENSRFNVAATFGVTIQN